MVQSWIIVLMIYFSGNSERVDIHTTDLIFENPIECNEFRLSPEFQNELIRKYKGMGIDYVRPYCRPVKEKDKIIVNKKGRKLNEQRI